MFHEEQNDLTRSRGRFTVSYEENLIMNSSTPSCHNHQEPNIRTQRQTCREGRATIDLKDNVFFLFGMIKYS